MLSAWQLGVRPVTFMTAGTPGDGISYAMPSINIHQQLVENLVHPVHGSELMPLFSWLPQATPPPPPPPPPFFHPHGSLLYLLLLAWRFSCVVQL